MSKMGVGDWDIDQNPISLGPDFALSAESRVKKVISNIASVDNIIPKLNDFALKRQSMT